MTEGCEVLFLYKMSSNSEFVSRRCKMLINFAAMARICRPLCHNDNGAFAKYSLHCIIECIKGEQLCPILAELSDFGEKALPLPGEEQARIPENIKDKRYTEIA